MWKLAGALVQLWAATVPSSASMGASASAPEEAQAEGLRDLLPGSMDVDEECSLGAFAAAFAEAQAPSVGGATPTARLFKVAADKLQPAPHPSGQASARGPQRASLSAEERFKFDLAMVKRAVRFGVRGEEGYPFGGSSVA